VLWKGDSAWLCKGLMHVLCNPMWNWHTTRVALLGPATAIDQWAWLYASLYIVGFCAQIHMKQGFGFHDTKVQIQKVGVRTYGSIAALPYHYSLILHCTWSNPGQTWIIFKVGLTRMTQTKHDLGNPTWFQRWFIFLFIAIRSKTLSLLLAFWFSRWGFWLVNVAGSWRGKPMQFCQRTDFLGIWHPAKPFVPS